MEKVVMLIMISVIGMLCSSAMIVLLVTLCSVLRTKMSDEESLIESSIALQTPILPTRKFRQTPQRAATIDQVPKAKLGPTRLLEGPSHRNSSHRPMQQQTLFILRRLRARRAKQQKTQGTLGPKRIRRTLEGRRKRQRQEERLFDEEKKKDASGGTVGGGSGGKLSLTGRGSDPQEERTGREPAEPAPAPPCPTSAQRELSEKTAKSSWVNTPMAGPSNGRKSVPFVIAKPSGPRALVKSAGSASSTTKGSSGSGPNYSNKARTPNSIDSAEKSCMAPSNVGAPPSWHLGWPIAGILLAIILGIFCIMLYFVIAKGIADFAEKAELEKMQSGYAPSSRSQRAARQKRHFGTTSDRVKFRVREPPDPGLP